MTTTHPPTRARRVTVSLLLCALILGLTPAPALAWWGWLEKWSGPGPFRGELYDLRVACFGGSAPDPQQMLELAQQILVEAGWLKTALSRGYTVTREDADKVQNLLDTLTNRLDDINNKFNVPEAALLVARAPQLVPKGTQSPSVNPKATLEATEQLQTLLKTKLAPAINAFARKAAAISGAGVLIPLCSPGEVRDWSVELNLDLWRNKDVDPDYAGGQNITLITFMPSLMYRVFKDKPTKTNKSGLPDILNVGGGVGFYAFRSRGFEDFRGPLAEVRFDLHFPSSWSHGPTLLHRLLATPTLRLGYMVAFGGFDADAFAATGDKARKLKTELNPTYGVFVNLHSLFIREMTIPH